jgi:hypothetical protein
MVDREPAARFRARRRLFQLRRLRPIRLHVLNPRAIARPPGPTAKLVRRLWTTGFNLELGWR